MLVREHFPQMPVHLSVQANAVNWASVEFCAARLTRVILSRRLALEEIEEIRQRVPDMNWKCSSTARCAWPIPALPAVRLHQQARPQPGYLHQRSAAGNTRPRGKRGE